MYPSHVSLPLAWKSIRTVDFTRLLLDLCHKDCFLNSILDCHMHYIELLITTKTEIICFTPMFILWSCSFAAKESRLKMKERVSGRRLWWTLCWFFTIFSCPNKDEEGKSLLFLEFCSLVWSQLFWFKGQLPANFCILVIIVIIIIMYQLLYISFPDILNSLHLI